jgi:hypothetical protein
MAWGKAMRMYLIHVFPACFGDALLAMHDCVARPARLAAPQDIDWKDLYAGRIRVSPSDTCPAAGSTMSEGTSVELRLSVARCRASPVRPGWLYAELS